MKLNTKTEVRKELVDIINKLDEQDLCDVYKSITKNKIQNIEGKFLIEKKVLIEGMSKTRWFAEKSQEVKDKNELVELYKKTLDVEEVDEKTMKTLTTQYYSNR